MKISRKITLIALTLFLGLISVNFISKKAEAEQIFVPIYVEYETIFSEEKLIEEIRNLNFKHPEIVLAQARLETGNFTSAIFLENNNLFGMKRAYSRPTTAIGTNRNHAVYDTWKDSLVDYALYTSTFMRNKSEREVLEHLGKYYAQDVIYEDKVRAITESIKRENPF